MFCTDLLLHTSIKYLSESIFEALKRQTLLNSNNTHISSSSFAPKNPINLLYLRIFICVPHICESLFLLIVEQLHNHKGRKFNIYSVLLNGLRRLLLADLINEIICWFSRFGSPRTATETARGFLSSWETVGLYLFLCVCWRLCSLRVFLACFSSERAGSPVRIAAFIVC